MSLLRKTLYKLEWLSLHCLSNFSTQRLSILETSSILNLLGKILLLVLPKVYHCIMAKTGEKKMSLSERHFPQTDTSWYLKLFSNFSTPWWGIGVAFYQLVSQSAPFRLFSYQPSLTNVSNLLTSGSYLHLAPCSHVLLLLQGHCCLVEINPGQWETKKCLFILFKTLWVREREEIDQNVRNFLLNCWQLCVLSNSSQLLT